MGRPLCRATCIVEEHLSDSFTDVLLASENLPDRFDEFIRRARFRHVACRARFERTHGELILRVHAEDEYRELRLLLLQLFEEVEAVLPRHVQVQYNYVPPLLAH